MLCVTIVSPLHFICFILRILLLAGLLKTARFLGFLKNPIFFRRQTNWLFQNACDASACHPSAEHPAFKVIWKNTVSFLKILFRVKKRHYGYKYKLAMIIIAINVFSNYQVIPLMGVGDFLKRRVNDLRH